MKSALVSIDFGRTAADFTASVAEMRLLAHSAGAQVLVESLSKRSRPDPALFMGSGKAAELAELVTQHELDLVLFNHALAPAQQRNLERVLGVRVVDRVALILDIFALRARSFEGKMQVELAQLQHLSTRLVKMWSHLERQKGGIGLRGPGESQLEMDKRIIGDKIKMLKERLDKVRRQRETQRRSRSRAGTPSVSIVGYTNAGKSTLFNALTKANTYAADQLFATLDTTSRRLYLPANQNTADADGLGSQTKGTQITGAHIVLSDTVGFIRELPTQLVAAFRATLEETIHADLILHVVDAASPERDAQIEQVNAVLAGLEGLDLERTPQWLIMNKIDAAGLEARTDMREVGNADSAGGLRTLPAHYVSARTGLGVAALRQALGAWAVVQGAHRHANIDAAFTAAHEEFE